MTARSILGTFGRKRLKIDILYVIADVDRHGNVRVYYRRKGTKKVRLWERWGHPNSNPTKMWPL